jgi:hypothetical protein
VADIHERALGKIENEVSLRSGCRPKRNIGGGLAHDGECGAGAHGKCKGSGEHFDQSAYVSPPLDSSSWPRAWEAAGLV